jgi:hypothetical protein
MYRLRKQGGMWLVYKHGRRHSTWWTFGQAAHAAKMAWLMQEQLRVLSAYNLISR